MTATAACSHISFSTTMATACGCRVACSAAGHARVYGLPGSYACMRELLGARARCAGGGDSACGRTPPTRCAQPQIGARAHCASAIRYQIVAGTVAEAQRKPRTYINFGARLAHRLHGRHRRQAFCAPIPNGPRRSPRSRASASRCAAGSNIATAPTSTIEDPSQIAATDESAAAITRSPAPGAR